MPGPSEDPSFRPAGITAGQAFRFWLKLGFISFGGPAGQIAIMHQELVVQRRWISERRFLHALNFCMLLPGPEAQQLATYLGWLMHRTRGGLAAGVLFILPSLFILIGLSWAYAAFGHVPWVAGIFYGIKPAITAVVLQAVYRIGGRVLTHRLMWILAGLSFVALTFLKIPFPAIIVGAALIGWIGGRLSPATFAQDRQGGKTGKPHPPAWLDDDTPVPDHAVFAWKRLAKIAVLGLALWSIPLAAVASAWGWRHVLPQLAWFFTKASLLTFGGAYAVLPYVFHGAAGQYAWLTPAQMMDGLALGETTPGPLIMVVVFAGFMGGYQSPALQGLFGGYPALLAGITAALWVTWFTFLPSFLFILGGGPLVESSQREWKFTAPLTAITAAVAGVIANLAFFFGQHALWPQGFGASLDVKAAAIGLMAAAGLFYFKLGMIPVLGLCAAAGMALTLSGF